jgi:uncharacterized protein YbaP (TraB family)
MHNRRTFLKYSVSLGITTPLMGKAETAPLYQPATQAVAGVKSHTPEGWRDQDHPSTFIFPTAGLAWQAERGAQRFLLVGTIHALASQDHPLPRLIDDCYARAAGLLMEFTPYEQAQPESRKAVQAKGYLPKSNGLMELLPEPTKQNLRSFLAGRPGLSFLLDCKPWLAAQWIQQTLAAECGLEGVHGVESYLSRRATADHKPIQLLESQADALNALDGLPEAVQIESLNLTLHLAKEGKYRTLTDSLRMAWKAGDERGLNALFATTTEDTLAYRKSIIENRNQTWLQRIKTLKVSGTWMIAAGTQHFCGEKSLPTLLAGEGFSVKRIR